MNRLEERVADQSAEEVIRNALWGCHFAESESSEMRESMKSVWTHEWERCQSKTQRIISALESQGLKIVPVEPTEAMWTAGNDVVDDARADDVSPDPAEVYAAMLNAVEG